MGMRTSRIHGLLLAAGMTWAAVASADGMHIQDGRYADGPVTVLKLSAEQVLTVKTKRVVVLTKTQKQNVMKDAGVAPSVLQVYSLKAATQDCTCGDFNTAIWFAADQIEVPHRFLLNDAEAEKAMEGLESIE